MTKMLHLLFRLQALLTLVIQINYGSILQADELFTDGALVRGQETTINVIYLFSTLVNYLRLIKRMHGS